MTGALPAAGAIVGLLEGKTQPAGGLQHAPRRGLFHRRALIEHPVDGGYADARFTRNVGKGDFSGDFFKVFVAMNERNDRNYHGCFGQKSDSLPATAYAAVPAG